MNPDSDTLLQIQPMASSLMQPREIAILLDLDPDKYEHEINHNTNSDIYRHYYKGRLQTKLDMRKIMIQLAKAGSPQAEVLADKYINQK